MKRNKKKNAREDEREDEVLSGISEIVNRLLKHNGQNFVPFFQELFPYILGLLDSVHKASDRQVGLCIFDDLIEYGAPTSLPYIPHFIKAMIEYCGDTDVGVRQAAAYGLGVCALFGRELFTPYLQDAVAHLTALIKHPDAMTKKAVFPTENAISSIGKICGSHAGFLNIDQLILFWLSCLPTTHDKIESKLIYAQLCSFIEKSHPSVLGKDWSNLPKIVGIFATVLDTDLIDEEITMRIRNILKQMQVNVPQAILQQTFLALTPPQQHLISTHSRT